jgi:hypothetical protein
MASLGETASIEDQDFVGTLGRSQAVGDGHRGPPFDQTLDGVAESDIEGGVDG